MSSEIDSLYNYFSESTDSLTKKNKAMFLFIENQKHSIVNELINDSRLATLHISLLQSALLMTQSHPDVFDIVNLEKHFNLKLTEK
jgi:hypothetical protein